MQNQNENRQNQVLRKFAEWIIDYRLIVIFICLALAVGSIVLCKNIYMDNSMEAYFMDNDKSYTYYKQFMNEYGNDEFLYIVYSAKKGIFHPETLQTTRKLVENLETVPFVDKVNAVTNVEFIEGDEEGDIRIYDLMENFPATQEEADLIKQKLLSKPIYVKSYISQDANFAAILCEMDDKPEDDPNFHDKIGSGLKSVLSRPEYKDFTFHPVGEPVLNSEFYELIEKDAGMITLVSYSLIFGFLALFFRQAKGVFAPISAVVFSVILVLGFIGLMGFPITGMFGITPSLLIAIGVADGVHLMSEYRTHLREGKNNRKSIIEAVRLMFIPCLFTSITTAVGFGSLLITPVRAIREYAWYTVFGVISVFFFSFTILLVILSFAGKKSERLLQQPKKKRFSLPTISFMDGMLGHIARFNKNHHYKILIAIVIIAGICIFGMTKLEINSSYLEEIGDHAKVTRDYRFVDKIMGGSGNFELLLDSGKPEGVTTVKFVTTLEKIQNYADTQEYIVNKTNSVVDIIKDVNSSLHNNSKAYYALPDTDKEVSQYVLFYEFSGGEELEKLISADIATARLSIAVKHSDSKTAARFIKDLESFLASTVPREYTYNVTGASYLMVQAMGYIEKTQINSILVALGIISLMMVIVFRSIKIGLISMVPNIFPIIVTLGFMGFAGIWLDYVRVLIACIAIGIAVDDTIHFIFRFRLEFKRLGNYENALDATMLHVGRAITTTTVILVIGFSVSIISQINDMHYFGLLATMCIMIALLADYFICPSLILVTKPFGKEFTAKKFMEQTEESYDKKPVAKLEEVPL